jgi:hypothetical protein
MRRALWSLVLLAGLLGHWRALTASEEELVRWREVSLVADVPEYGAVRVSAAREGERLAYLRVELASGVHLEVPPVGLAGLEIPQLERLQVRYEVGYDPTPWLYVVVPHGEPILVGGEVRWAEASYAIQGDRFVDRRIRSWTPEGELVWTSIDLP